MGETRARTATVSPRMHGRGAAHRAAPWRECGRGCPRGENRRADSCRSQSCPAAAVDLGADPLPVRVLELLAEAAFPVSDERRRLLRSEEHTSELQSRNDISYAVF